MLEANSAHSPAAIQWRTERMQIKSEYPVSTSTMAALSCWTLFSHAQHNHQSAAALFGSGVPQSHSAHQATAFSSLPKLTGRRRWEERSGEKETAYKKGAWATMLNQCLEWNCWQRNKVKYNQWPDDGNDVRTNLNEATKLKTTSSLHLYLSMHPPRC